MLWFGAAPLPSEAEPSAAQDLADQVPGLGQASLFLAFRTAPALTMALSRRLAVGRRAHRREVSLKPISGALARRSFRSSAKSQRARMVFSKS